MAINTIEIGNTPWTPHNNIEQSRVVLEEKEFPLVGRYQFNGKSYGFFCVDGENEDNNTWIYGKIQDSNIVEDKYSVRDFSTVREFIKYLSDKFTGSILFARSLNYQISEVKPVSKSDVAKIILKTRV